jgi:hypothetical protein
MEQRRHELPKDVLAAKFFKEQKAERKRKEGEGGGNGLLQGMARRVGDD